MYVIIAGIYFIILAFIYVYHVLEIYLNEIKNVLSQKQVKKRISKNYTFRNFGSSHNGS